MKGLYIEVKPTLGQEPSPDILSVTMNVADALSKCSERKQLKNMFMVINTHRKEGENIGTSGDTQAHYRPQTARTKDKKGQHQRPPICTKNS
jgi:hypothetical protein